MSFLHRERHEATMFLSSSVNTCFTATVSLVSKSTALNTDPVAPCPQLLAEFHFWMPNMRRGGTSLEDPPLRRIQKGSEDTNDFYTMNFFPAKIFDTFVFKDTYNNKCHSRTTSATSTWCPGPVPRRGGRGKPGALTL